MADYDPSELIAVCESIVEDGEISGKDLYDLAKWLNDHRAECSNWPANLLVQPLQDAFSDRNITTLEMRKVGRVLVRIRREWAKRQFDDAVASKKSAYAVENLPAIDLSRPLLPQMVSEVRVNSHSRKGVFYDVHLSGPTCTCPDWRSWRCKLPIGHLTRCCKHVFDAYAQLEPQNGWPGWLGAFFEQAWPPHPKQDWMVFSVDRSLVLASTAPKGWADVFAEDAGTYDRFGYNVREDRWAYGIEPVASDRIATAIMQAGGE